MLIMLTLLSVALVSVALVSMGNTLLESCILIIYITEFQMINDVMLIFVNITLALHHTLFTVVVLASPVA